MLALYRLLSRLLPLLLPLAAPFFPKLRSTLAWRRETGNGAARAAAIEGEPRLWIHAASAGELEQARPLIDVLRLRYDKAAIMLTLSSISARAAAADIKGVDLVLPLPADTPRDMKHLVGAFSPRAICLVKWDLWPNLIAEAVRGKVPILLLGAALGPDSGRIRFPARFFYAALHARLSAVGAVSEEDGERFLACGLRQDQLHLTGDSRFDRVIARREENRPDPFPALDRGQRAFCLVGGSVWPTEEDMLLGAFAALRGKFSELRLLLVPHEPTVTSLSRLEAECDRLALPCDRLSRADTFPAHSVLLCDKTGILPELYAAGSVAVVGGGFGAGVHSVLEPAARALPVLAGPSIGRIAEGRGLLAARAALVFKSGEELAALWKSLLDDPVALGEASRAARDYVESGSGAAERTVLLAQQFIDEDG